jgi:hypothetical protein
MSEQALRVLRSAWLVFVSEVGVDLDAVGEEWTDLVGDSR